MEFCLQYVNRWFGWFHNETQVESANSFTMIGLFTNPKLKLFCDSIYFAKLEASHRISPLFSLP